MLIKSYIFCCSFILVALSAFSQTENDSLAEKYNLFHAFPGEQMRDMETDRPDVTESPYSVPAGHFQFESDLYRADRIKYSQENIVHHSINFANYKIGLNGSTDLQFVCETFYKEKNVETGQISYRGGLEELVIRLKKNIVHKPRMALAIMPYVEIPFHQQNFYNFGIIIPYSYKINDDWTFGAQIETEFYYYCPDRKLLPQFLCSWTFGRDLTRRLGFFLEQFITQGNQEFHFYQNGGIIYTVNKNLRFDTGFNYGFTSGSGKSYFLGVSFRI